MLLTISSLRTLLNTIILIFQAWTLGDDLCKVFPVFFYGNVAVSVLSMVGLTINRYTLILHPSRYSKIYTPLSLCFQLFMIWAFSFGVMVCTVSGNVGVPISLDSLISASSIVRNLGPARTGRGNVLLYDSQEK